MSAPNPSPVRRAAYEVVRRVFEHGAYADRAFPAAAERHRLDRRSRAQAQRLAYGAIRGRGCSDYLIAELARRRIEKLDPPVLAALRIGIWELLHSDGTPAHAAVNEAVDLARGGGAGRATALVNALLRRVAEGRGAELLSRLDPDDPSEAAILFSYPPWIVRLWFDELGPDSARSLLEAFNQPAERALRQNPPPPASSPDLGQARKGEILWPAGCEVRTGSLQGEAAAAIEAGRLVPQSRASQLVVGLLEPGGEDRVLDLCAGPGIKATQIAALQAASGGDGELVCVEPNRSRAAQITEMAGRLGVPAPHLIERPGEDPDLAEALAGSFDRVLVDPPCSALGTMAARPDVRWNREQADLAELSGRQAALLARGLTALRPGGLLIYSTCTISRRENEQILAAALAAHPEVELDDLGAVSPSAAAIVSPTEPRALQTRPDRDRTDGFFIARLRRP